MNRQVRWSIIGAAVFGIGGFAVVWGAAVTSREAELAREYLMATPSIRDKYKSVDGLMLTGFRMAGSRSHLTYWASTGDGHKLLTVVVDKTGEPWTIAEPP